LVATVDTSFCLQGSASRKSMFVRKDKLHSVDEDDCKADEVSSGVQLNEDSNMSQGSSNHGLIQPYFCKYTAINMITFVHVIGKGCQF